MFDFLLVGVAAPEGVGVDVDDIAAAVVDDSVGVPLLEGEDTCNVDVSSSLSSATVVAGSSALPSSMSCTSAGRFVEAERNSRTLETVWTGRTFSLMATKDMLVSDAVIYWLRLNSLLPPAMVTWMTILSAGSSLLEVLDVAEPDRERMMARLCVAESVVVFWSCYESDAER